MDPVEQGKHLLMVMDLRDLPFTQNDGRERHAGADAGRGSVSDSTRHLAGHPARMIYPTWSPADAERGAIALGNPFLTAWAGPWGAALQPILLLYSGRGAHQILNNDGVLHNIHTYSTKNQALDLAQPAFKEKVELRFSEPEEIAVRCDIHGWMSAWVVVSEHRYYVVTDAEGGFILDNVPPGSYRMKSWHGLLGEQTLEVTVESGVEASVIFQYAE